MSLHETRRRGDLPAPLAVFARILDVLAGVTIALAGTALVALVVMMGWLVFGRYVLNDTPTWIERGATLAILCIAMPVALADGRLMLSADILTAIEPGGWLHEMWEHADKAVLLPAVEVVPIADAVALMPKPQEP